MARIIKKSTYEQFDFKGKLQFRLLNPVFYEQNSFTFEANLPSNYNNDKLLGFFRQPEIAKLSIEEPVIVETLIDSYEGIMYVNRFDGKNYVFNIIITNNTERIKNMLLTDLDKTYDFSALTQEEIFDIIAGSLNGNSDYVFCAAETPDAFRDMPFNALGKKANQFEYYFDKHINDNHAQINAYSYYFKNNEVLSGASLFFTPFFYFKTIIREIVNAMGLILSDSVFTSDSDLSKLCLFNTCAINKVDIMPDGNDAEETFTITNIESTDRPRVTYSGVYSKGAMRFVKIIKGNNPADDWQNLNTGFYEVVDEGSYLTLEFNANGFDPFGDENDHHFTIIPIETLEAVNFLDEKNTIATLNDKDWLTGSYVAIRAVGTYPNFGAYNYYRVTRVDSKHFEIDGIKDILYQYYTPAVGTFLKVNFCSLSSILQSIQLKYHLPSIQIGKFITEIEKFWIKFIYDKGTCRVVKLKDLLSAEAIDCPDIISDPVPEHEAILGYTMGFTMDSDDVEISEKVSELSEEFQIKAPVANLAALPTLGNENNDLRLVQNLNAYYKFSRYLDGELTSLSSTTLWRFLGYNINGKIVGDGSEDYTSEFCPLLWNMDLSQAGNMKIYFDKLMSCYNFRDLNKSDALRMFFYRGLQHDPVVGGNTPCVTGGVYNHDHNVVGGLSLEFTSDYNLYKILGEDWINWNMNMRKDFNAKILWQVSTLKNLDWTKKARVKGINYFIKYIEFEDNNDVITFGNTGLARC